ncbi:MAG: GGDEF domain-containing protein [Acidimicrobiales bacterium]
MASPVEALRDRGERSVEVKALALLYAGGATAALLSLAFPESGQVNRGAIAILASLGYPVGAAVLLWGRRFSRPLEYGLLATGTALTGAGIYNAHGAAVGASAAFFYVWVAMFAFHFFPLRAAVAQLVFAGATYAVVLGLIGGSGVWPQWVITMFTAAVAGSVMVLVGRQLRRAAVTDHLTGLPNRHMLGPLMRVEIARAFREKLPLSVAIVDIDGFKAINDRLGHGAGDDVLVQEVRAWVRQLRASDTLVRYGGDEFLVVMPGAEETEARAVLTRLSNAGPIPASAGIAELQAGDRADDLIGRADRALYRAKGIAR